MTEYQKILEKLKNSGIIEESDVSALVESFNTAVTEKVTASVKKQEDEKLQEEQLKSNLVQEIKDGYTRLLTEERKKMLESFELENEAIIEEAVTTRLNKKMEEVNLNTSKYKEEMLDKVVSVMTDYIEEHILPNVHESIIEEAYSVLVSEADEKDEAIRTLKDAVVKISSIIEEGKDGKDEEDEEDDKDTKKEEAKKKSESDVEVEAEMKDDDEQEEIDDEEEDTKAKKKSKKVEESFDFGSIRDRVRSKIVEEQNQAELRQRAKQRALKKLNEEKRNADHKAKLVQEHRKAQRRTQMVEEEMRLVQEQVMIKDLIEEETEGLSKSQINTVKRILDGRNLRYIQENIESVVEDIIEESIGYSRQRTRSYSNMVVDHSNYSDLNEKYISDANAGNKHIAQAREYL